MSPDVSHLLDEDALPNDKPVIRPLAGRPMFIPGYGIAVTQSNDGVMFSLDEDFTRSVRAIEDAYRGARESAARIPFGFSASYNAETSNIEISGGVVYDISWEGGQGYIHREHQILPGVLGNVEFPCLIYGRLVVLNVLSNEDTILSTIQTIEGSNYSISVETETAFRKLSIADIPGALVSTSIFEWRAGPPNPASNLFRFRVAEFDDERNLTAQYAVGSVTVPQSFAPRITSLRFAQAP